MMNCTDKIRKKRKRRESDCRIWGSSTSSCNRKQGGRLTSRKRRERKENEIKGEKVVMKEVKGKLRVQRMNEGRKRKRL